MELNASALPQARTTAIGTSSSIDPHVSRSIDAIRGAAALGVIWGHSIYGTPRVEISFASRMIPIELNGGVWVWIFLSISGYLVGRGFCDGGYERTMRGYGRFLFNRALRILPLAYLALAISFVCFAISGQQLPPEAVRQIFFVPHNNNMSMVGGFWSIAAELHFYVLAGLLVPIVFHAFRVDGLLGSLAVFLGAAYLSVFWVAYTGDNAYQPRTFVGNLPLFVCGLLLSQMRGLRFQAARIVKLALIAGLLAIVWWLQNYRAPLFWGWGDHKWPLGGAMAIGMAIAALTVLVIPGSASSRNSFVSGALLRPALNLFQWCGVFCYGIYVWHGVLGTLNNLFWQVPPGFQLLELLLLAVPLAYGSYHLIERPIMRFRLSHRGAIA